MTDARSGVNFPGGVNPEFDSRELRGWLAGLLLAPPGGKAVDPGAGIYSVRAPVKGLFPLAVKYFGAEPLLKCGVDRLRAGGRAKRAFDYAVFFALRNAPTPRPVAWLERWEKARLRRQILVTEYPCNVFSMRDALIHHYKSRPFLLPVISLLKASALAVRRMHEAGFEHRDLGNQNIIVRFGKDEEWSRAWVVDLHRGRPRGRLSDRQRGRDNARIALPPGLRRIFFNLQYAPAAAPDEFLKAEYSARRRYRMRVKTRRLRHPFSPQKDTEPCYPRDEDIMLKDGLTGRIVPVLSWEDGLERYYRGEPG